jgi:alpha-1,3-rhamnosyl/mannosyltransferase
MRIGFDVSPLTHDHPPGVVRATAGLVQALERRAAEVDERSGLQPFKLEIVRLAPQPGEDLRAWRQRRLPALARELALFGIHSPVSAFPWRGPGKRLQTIHELPWRHGARENADLRHRLWAALGPRRADLVIAPSAHVARDLPRRARVVPWGRDPRFAEEPPPGAVDEVLLGRYRLPEEPLALCLGAVRAKKNLAAVLAGLAELRARNGPRLHAVVTGPETADLRRDLGTASKLGLARYVSTPGHVPDEHLPGLVRLAAVVPVLSRSEGFAFPVLEALASGTPVLVPPDSAQAELAGEAGIAVDPDDPTSVADGFERALRERHLREARLARAAPFTWERAAAAVAELWSSLA